MKKTKNLELEHHVENSAGQDVGFLHIDVKNIEGIDLWQKIDRLLVEYTKVFPNEMRVHLWENQQIRRTRKDQYASLRTNSGMRWGASIPPGLYFKLQELEPMLFAEKKLFRKFMKRYRGFTIPEKI